MRETLRPLKIVLAAVPQVLIGHIDIGIAQEVHDLPARELREDFGLRHL
ncbi:MAG: hypothetical protein ACT4O5_13990 [Gammaproteobacteria bacterium]